MSIYARHSFWLYIKIVCVEFFALCGGLAYHARIQKKYFPRGGHPPSPTPLDPRMHTTTTCTSNYRQILSYLTYIHVHVFIDKLNKIKYMCLVIDQYATYGRARSLF